MALEAVSMSPPYDRRDRFSLKENVSGEDRMGFRTAVGQCFIEPGTYENV